RGSQTVGELRGRAARMEPIKDLADLRPTLDSLENKKLIQYLTPQGRGCIVTHTLYLDRELDKVRREASAMQAAAGSESSQDSESPVVPQWSAQPSPSRHADQADLTKEISALRAELATLRSELATARAEFESTSERLRSDLAELNRQLGN